MTLVEESAHPLKFLNRFSSFKFYKLATVPRFNPADPEVGDQKPHHVAVPKVCHKRGSMSVPAIAAGIAVAVIPKSFRLFAKAWRLMTRS